MEYQEIDAEKLPDSWKTAVSPRWGHSLHTLCSRSGSFPPKLAHYIICRYSKIGDKVLDLYSGKGTAPLEACLLGRVGIGNDLCPDAYVLTRAKTKPPKKSDFLQYLRNIERRLQDADVSNVPEEVSLYFKKETLEQIVSVKEMISSELESSVSEERLTCIVFLQAMMLGILHGTASYALSLPVPHSFAMSPSYVRKKVLQNPRKFATPKRNVIDCLRRKANLVYRKPIPSEFRQGLAFIMDASRFSLDIQVDLALTSPPYFDAHTYAWDNWLRLWFLGYDFKEVSSKLLRTGSEQKYLLHLEKSLKKIYRLLKENTVCFIVVGDVKGHEPTAYLIADLIERSQDIGFEVDRIINDEIDRKRKYLYGNNNHVGIVKDRILELHKGEPESSSIHVPWSYQ